MVDKILENYSKAVESTLKLQQEMLRNWTMQCPVRDAEVVFGRGGDESLTHRGETGMSVPRSS